MGVYSSASTCREFTRRPGSPRAPQVIGRVALAEGASVWFGAVVRGDVEDIRIGRNSNIQDNSVLHADAGSPLTIGENVTVGHHVMLHGCTVGDGALIGIRAVVLNGATIGRNCIVGAGSVVTEARASRRRAASSVRLPVVVVSWTPEQIAVMQQGAAHYVANAARFREELKRIG